MGWPLKAKSLFSDPSFALSAMVLLGGLLIPAAWLEAHVPRLCLWHAAGLPCWACGLTRSVCLAGHGELAASWTQHPLGLPLFAAALATVGFKLFRALRAD